jgi:hypothetical protein
MSFQSKMLKGSDKWGKEAVTRWERLRCWFWDTAFYKFYNDVSWKFFFKPIRDVKKMWQWYWNVFENDFDFDAAYIYKILAYKMRRVLKCLENGHAVQEPQDLKALKLAIKLADRLFADDYYFDAPHRRHDKKWGELQSWTMKEENSEDRPGGPYYRWHSKRPNAITEEQQKEEREDMKKVWEEEDFLRKRDERWFHGIVMKYRRNWWD